MTHLRLLILVALAGILLDGTATANPPAGPLGQARTALASAERIYVYLSLARRHDFGPSGGASTLVSGGLHVDLAARVAVFDGPHFRWRYAEDTTTFHNRLMGSRNPPMPVPAADPIFAVVLDEIDTGFADSTWTREDPPPFERGRVPRPAGEWWRLDLPGIWDDGLRIYLDVKGREGCELYKMVVLYADTDRVAQFANPFAGNGVMDLRFPLCDAVHLDPDFAESRYSPDDPLASPLYLPRSLHHDQYR